MNERPSPSNQDSDRKSLRRSRMDRDWSRLLERRRRERIYREPTVDAVLEDQSILVTEDRFRCFQSAPSADKVDLLSQLASQRPLLSAVVKSIEVSGSPCDKLMALSRFTSNIEKQFPSPEHSAASGYYRTPDDFWWGGTEELVIAKGSDWCAEVARVFCGLSQVCEIPSRIVFTYGSDDGHIIAECYTDKGWCLVDPLAPKVYETADHLPVGAVDMVMAAPAIRREYTASGEGYYVDPRFFRYVAVSEYWLTDAASYDYGLSFCNDHYRNLLGPIWNV